MYKSIASLRIVKIYLLTACAFLLLGSIASAFLDLPFIHGTILFFFVLIPGFFNAFSIYTTIRYLPSTVCIWRDRISVILFFLAAICWILSLFINKHSIALWTSSIYLILGSMWVLSWQVIVYFYKLKLLNKIPSLVAYAFVYIHGFLLLVIPSIFVVLGYFSMNIEDTFWSILHPISYAFIILMIGIIANSIFELKNRLIYYIHHIAIILLLLLAFGVYIVYSLHYQNPFGGEAYIKLTMMSAVPIFFLLLYWIISLWKNNMTINISTCFALMCMSLFIFGGLMDIFFIQYHLPIHLGDTYFTVAHFHLIIGVCIAIAWLSCIYHDWAKIFFQFNASLLDNIFYKFHFWSTFIGIYIIFTMMYYVGLIGIPKLYFVDTQNNTNTTVLFYKYMTISVSAFVWIVQIAFIIHLLVQTIKCYSHKKEIY